MTTITPFSCFIIGTGTLPRQCAQRLQQRNHQIVGIATADATLRRWAADQDIPTFSTAGNWQATLREEPVDYLFSIVNDQILPGEVLRLPRRWAINYHDGPLPRYAGSQATSWAILNRETDYGVTWHVMNEKVDAGPILKQTPVAIAPSDTALTLNAKCYDAALQGFAELITELETNTAQPRPQLLQQRTFYGRFHRPPAAAILNWTQPAAHLDALVRALDFGAYPNPLALPKLLLDGEIVYVAKTAVSPTTDDYPPGAIQAITGDTITVATGDGLLQLRELMAQSGRLLTPDQLPLATGLQLPLLDAETADSLTHHQQQVTRHDTYWLRRLDKRRPVELPYPAPDEPTAASPQRLPLTPPETADHALLPPAFIAYLARISGNNRFDVGYCGPAQRELAQFAEILATAVPLPVDLDDQDTAADIRKKWGRARAATQEHVSYARDIWRRYPALRDGELPDKWPVLLAEVAATSDFCLPDGCQLALVVGETGCELVCDAGQITAATAQRIRNHLLTLLDEMNARPHDTLADWRLLPEAERQQVVEEWNETAVDYEETRYVHQIFEAQAAATPNAPALTCAGETLTYAQLNARANQLAHYLQAQGVGPQSRVALYLERSVEMVVAIYATLKAGAAYVPLDPDYPAERLAFMLNDVQPALILTDNSQWLIDNCQLTIDHWLLLSLKHDWPKVAAFPTTTPTTPLSDDSLAYVIYTSGSTGQPKGVMNRHGAIRNRILWMQAEYQLDAGDTVAQKTPYSFDVSVWEFLWPLMVGARLAIAKPDGHRDANYLVEFIKREQVTTIHFVPSMLQLFLQARDVATCAGLRRVICSGEALTPDLRDRFFAALDADLHNLYGPTEAAIDVTYWPCRRDDRRPTVPIGRPIANTQIYILDRHGHPAPIGAPGELHIGGVNLARGYLNRPALTAKTFVPNPFKKDELRRMNDEEGSPSIIHNSSLILYKTGDLARWREDGAIEYLGRIDFQVKVRGFRVELGEIEAALGQHSAVSAATVTTQPTTTGQTRLVAYVVLNDPVPDDDLRAYLHNRLPEYMVPAVFVRLDEFPLTTSGKVNRRALPEPEEKRPFLTTPYTPPQTPLQQMLVELWQDLLDVEPIGINDNFFELGGDSISGARLINRLQEKLDVYLYIVALFEAPTVTQFAHYLRAHYPEAVSQEPGSSEKPTSPRLTETDVDHFRSLLPTPTAATPPDPPNPTAVFILAPPRSGSTLLRVMLAGHPQLFAPPELDLLNFATLAERREAFAGPAQLRLEGAIRALMAGHGLSVQDAKAFMAQYEEQEMGTAAFYRLLQDTVAPQTLVDKSPAYALDTAVLRRAETDFHRPYYIHLLRHPHAAIHSFAQVRLDQTFFLWDHPFSLRRLAELIWLVSHHNILSFLQTIPAERQLALTFEDLVSAPEATMREVAGFLGVDPNPALWQPYHNPHERMADGLHDASRMVGDVKFHEYEEIDPTTADEWQERVHEDFLSDLTWDVAEQFGYDWPPSGVEALAGPPGVEALAGPPGVEALAGPPSGVKALAGPSGVEALAGPSGVEALAGPSGVEALAGPGVPAEASTPNLTQKRYPLSFGQQRLWFLDQFEPDSAAYNIPRAVTLRGDLDADALQQALDALAARHETLRTRFTGDNGVGRQIVEPSATIPLRLVDLSEVAEDEKETAVTHEIQAAVKRPFALGQPPLLRATLIRRQPQTHVLLLTTHHIITDGWSMSVLTDELAPLYGASTRGETADLLPLPQQYGDYARRQRERLQGGELQRQLDYWQQQLADHPGLLQLPTDRPRPPQQTFNGATYRFHLSPDLITPLTAFSRREGVTRFMALLAAFKILLMRYSGQTDVSVGTPVAGRTQPEWEKLIGLFVNTLVLRTDLSGQPSFRELLERVGQTTINALAHQEMPFERLVEALDPERNLDHHPLFQVMFVLQNAPPSPVRLPGLTIEPLDVDPGTAKFDITLSLRAAGDGYDATIEYNTDLFKHDTIRRMAGHYKSLLQGIIADPARPITDLPLLTDTEERQLATWNGTAAPLPDCCIHDLIIAQAQRTPGAIAAEFDGRTLTYAQLDQRSSQLAHHLQSLDVGPGSLVGIHVDRCLEMLIGLLGVLKAGAAYVPLDPTFPADRIAFMAQDANLATTLITDNSPLKINHSPFNIHHSPAVNLSQWKTIAAHKTTPPSAAVAPDAPAYVIYTSGSTGKPKGVVVDHRNVVNFLLAMQQEPGITADDVLLAVTTLSFDIAVLELLLPLTVGAKVVIADKATTQDGRLLAQTLTQTDATIMQATPATWQALQIAGWPGKADLTILCGGDTLSPELARRLLAQGRHLWNLYGPTETTIWSTAHKVEHVDGPIPIGRPIANTQIHLLDRHGHPVPVGVPGDLYIGGAGVAQGYWQRPRLTAERFKNYELGIRNYKETHQFIIHHSSLILYKTGDRARLRPDGTLEFLGRADFQVKVRGFRIELGEIEANLAQHPAVAEVVVVAHGSEAEETILVAYLTTLPNVAEPPAAADLRRFLQQSLPDYMVPAHFITLDAFPLTPNAKIDRKALPQPGAGASRDDDTPPRNATEAQLTAIWGSLLPASRVGIHDNFFDLGGHSLLALRLVAQIEQQLDVRLPLITLFQNPTIVQLAQVISQRPETGDWRLEIERRWDKSPISNLQSPIPNLQSLIPNLQSPLVPLQPHGDVSPFFCVHPVTGTVSCYVALAQAMGESRPFYGLQAPGLDGSESPLDTVPALATRYLEAVSEVRAGGPYSLGGWSLGGLVAYEMAQQLTARGETVDWVVLLDTAVPHPDSSPENDDAWLLARFLHDWQMGEGSELATLVARLRRKSTSDQRQFVVARAQARGLVGENEGWARIRPLFQVFRANMAAYRQYRPTTYDGRMLLLHTQDHTAENELRRWRKLAQHLAVEPVAGNHYTLLAADHVKAVATKLRGWFKRDESRITL